MMICAFPLIHVEYSVYNQDVDAIKYFMLKCLRKSTLSE